MAALADQPIRSHAHDDGTKPNILLKQTVHNLVQRIDAHVQKYGVHSRTVMAAAGFQYTGERDTALCANCQLEVSDWTEEMIPFAIHAERSPHCPFVQSRIERPSSPSSSSENRVKRQKTESSSGQFEHHYRLIEVTKLKELRRRTFSHWSTELKDIIKQMIVAGFFGCNVRDRVICLYCGCILQEWEPDTDDPVEVHRTLSPQCPYVLSVLAHAQSAVPIVLDDTPLNTEAHRSDDANAQSTSHSLHNDMSKRLESFATWSQADSPSVEELARAGFFYRGHSGVVTCFHCNGSLHNFGPNDDPLVQHTRWFPHCSYAQRLQLDDTERATREEERPTSRQLPAIDANLLSRFVAARVDLPISQNLLDQPFKLAVIKRCWEDQLQLKHDDFLDLSELHLACTILQSQIDLIQGNKDNILIPSRQMRLIRENKQNPLLTPAKANEPEPMQVEVPVITPEIEPTITEQAPEVSKTSAPSNNKSLVNACVICHQEEKRLACVPCGHFAVCVSCGKALRLCPLCRKEVRAFMRIYV